MMHYDTDYSYMHDAIAADGLVGPYADIVIILAKKYCRLGRGICDYEDMIAVALEGAYIAIRQSAKNRVAAKRRNMRSYVSRGISFALSVYLRSEARYCRRQRLARNSLADIERVRDESTPLRLRD